MILAVFIIILDFDFMLWFRACNLFTVSQGVTGLLKAIANID